MKRTAVVALLLKVLLGCVVVVAVVAYLYTPTVAVPIVGTVANGAGYGGGVVVGSLPDLFHAAQRGFRAVHPR